MMAIIIAGPIPGWNHLFADQARSQTPGFRSEMSLDDLLKRTAEYCRKLESAVLDFVCRESVEEIQTIPRIWSRGGMSAPFSAPRLEISNQTKAWLYDYQLIQKGGKIEERRSLLQEDGKVKREDDASLKGMRFWHKRVIMGPIGLFGAAVQSRLAYRIVGRETIEGAPVYVIDVSPAPGPASGLYGKAWVRMSDAAILKIEWRPESMGDYKGLVEYAEAIGAELRLTFSSEYALEKNGIRFPSAYHVTEAYIPPLVSTLARMLGGRELTRSNTNVIYGDYKYFTVETDVRIRS
jgi:hypothetical protein